LDGDVYANRSLLRSEIKNGEAGGSLATIDLQDISDGVVNIVDLDSGGIDHFGELAEVVIEVLKYRRRLPRHDRHAGQHSDGDL